MIWEIKLLIKEMIMNRHVIFMIISMVYSSNLLAGAAPVNNNVGLDKNLFKMKLKQEPNNQLYVFDLAYTFYGLKKYNKAIKLYSQTKLLSGEMGWYSEYMIGKCYDGKGDWDNALKYYNSAFKRRSTRAEPLFEMTKHYFAANKHEEVCFFATIGTKIEYPKDDNLYIEADIYNYKFYEQLSISAYYVEKYKMKGTKYIDKLLFSLSTPPHLKENSLNNLFYYLENIKNVEYIPIKAKMPLLTSWSSERYKPCNASIIRTDNGYMVNCRAVNYVQLYPDYVVMDCTRNPQTKNVVIEYDKNLKQYFQTQVIEDPSLVRYQTAIQGLEDVRLFRIKDEIYFTATTCQLNERGIPKMCFGKFEKNKADNNIFINKITLLQSPYLERTEKNWMPLVIDEQLYLIYGYSPYIIYKPNCVTGECTEFINKVPEFDFSRFSGSTPPIAFDDGYLLMIHEGIWQDRKYYIHRFLYLDKNLEIKKVSKPFAFKHKGVEMCCGMVIDEVSDKLIMTIALEDREAYLGLIDVSNVRSLLKSLVK